MNRMTDEQIEQAAKRIACASTLSWGLALGMLRTQPEAPRVFQRMKSFTPDEFDAAIQEYWQKVAEAAGVLKPN